MLIQDAVAVSWQSSCVDQPLSLTIGSLADCPEVAPTLAGWHWSAWGGEAPASTESDWLAIVQRRAGDDVPFTLVAWTNGEPVGVVSVCWDDIDDRYPDEGPWISGMVVRSNARNLGVGRALLAAAERCCVEQGHRALWLHTSEAKRFYQRCGWHLEADKPGLGRDAVLSKRFPATESL